MKSKGRHLSHKVLECLIVTCYLIPIIMGQWILVNIYGKKYRIDPETDQPKFPEFQYIFWTQLRRWLLLE